MKIKIKFPTLDLDRSAVERMAPMLLQLRKATDEFAKEWGRPQCWRPFYRPLWEPKQLPFRAPLKYGRRISPRHGFVRLGDE